MKLTREQWDLGHLHDHLQAAAELEAWTIPYYLSAMFSVVDRSSDAYQLIQSVVNQEMLHLQLVSNVANAYGLSPVLSPAAFVYADTVPHLDFSLDPDNPTQQFSPYSPRIGPLDESRINTMCLIEYPDWDTGGYPDYHDDITEYGSIGAFYDALEYGGRQLASDLAGGVAQVDLFSAFYRDLPTMTVHGSGTEAWPQVQLLIDLIRDQGEAAKAADAIAPPNRNTADDPEADRSHYEKFVQIRSTALPATYPVKDPADYDDRDHKLAAVLRDDFARFTQAVTQLCAGRRPPDFEILMVALGGDILSCWKAGVTPQFS
ncbi:MAG TPA: ferritin-like domain-containing protein [Microlunatus sp.]|nr:ferritin-like domain-containing protein [Microlunatus sp.]